MKEYYLADREITDDSATKTIKITVLLLLFFYSILPSFAQTNPGGISTNIQLWLKADKDVLNGGSSATDGDAVNTWQDQTSARTNDATDVNISPPTFRNNTNDYINYNPVVDFDGINDGLDFGNDYIFSTGTGSQNGMTFFAIVQPDPSSGKISQYITDFGQLANAGYGFHYGSERFGMHTPTDHGGAASSQSHSSDTLTTLVRFTVDFGTDQTLTLNGSSIPAKTDAITLTALTATEINENATHANNGPFTIGRQSKNLYLSYNNGRLFDGSIAEIVGYNTDLSTASGSDISRIESYLAIKYGITLDNSSGGTAGNYFSSTGTTIWNASLSPSHHNDIIGIGRDDNSDLTQKQSHQLDDSTRVYISTLHSSNAGNSGSFSTDEQFLFIGHNTAELQSLGSSEFPPALNIYSRIEREWKITNTTFNGTFSLDITLNTSPINPTDLRVLIDTDGNFIDATMFSPTISVSGTTVTISEISTSMIPVNSTRYLTIVSLKVSTPLPVELVNFNATAIENNSVHLKWQTASEMNNDFFTIERSINGQDWQEVTKIEGAGNSSSLLSYSTTDNNPYSRISYYRLKQTDFDGQFEYSQIRSVNIEQLDNSRIEIYPNPATHQITIKGSSSELESIVLYNTLGQNVTSLINQVITNETQLDIDMSKLNTGMYYVKTKTTANKVYKQ